MMQTIKASDIAIPDRKVWIEGDEIVIGELAYYAIPIEQANSPEAILNWVRHLAGKRSVDGQTTQEFIDVARKASGGLTPLA